MYSSTLDALNSTLLLMGNICMIKLLIIGTQSSLKCSPLWITAISPNVPSKLRGRAALTQLPRSIFKLPRNKYMRENYLLQPTGAQRGLDVNFFLKNINNQQGKKSCSDKKKIP